MAKTEKEMMLMRFKNPGETGWSRWFYQDQKTGQPLHSVELGRRSVEFDQSTVETGAKRETRPATALERALIRAHTTPEREAVRLYQDIRGGALQPVSSAAD